MNVEFRRSFVKDVEKTTDSRLRQRVREVIAEVEAAQTLADVDHVRKLRDGEGYYRIRVRDYRLGIFWEGDTDHHD